MSVTTLLQCITGQLRVQGGSLQVLGKAPLTQGHGVPGRSIGYMPQEIALYQEFTLAETLSFFARCDAYCISIDRFDDVLSLHGG